ncbi:ATP-binding protein [Butyricicoccus faecihominis]|uniref:sensor histidine kinase n=1 Tax=Butyricicoccus faecihominis TaxID=1712515 RepID=UPI00247988E7|nr:ATP-binding protein [Butyricicoccus faecihominis]MCQ5128896.1 ATP-binding protein [Butyricicoccus faecihominis]
METSKNRRIPAWALALCYLALAVAALALFHSYTVTDAEKIFLTPMFEDSKGWDIYRLDEAGGRVALTPKESAEITGTVYLSRVLDPAYEENGYTTLELDGPVSVFLDGNLLYTTAPGSGEDVESVELPTGYEVPAAGEIPRLTLPPGYGGKTLTLVFAQDAADESTPTVSLSNRAAEDALTATTANRLGMPAAAYMTAAFLLLGLFLYGGVQGKWDWPMLLLTLAAALQAFYQLREYDIQLVYRSALDIPAAALIPPLFTALPLCYLLCRMERGHGRRRAALILIPAAVSLLPPLLYLFGLSIPGSPCTEALYLSIAATLVYAVLEAHSGNRGFRVFLAGLGALIAALAVACLFSGSLAAYVGAVLEQVVRGLPSLPLYWCGAALFVLCACMSVGDATRHMAESRNRADMLIMQVSALRRQQDVVARSEEKIRLYRHDMRFTLHALTAMLERGDIAGALEHLGKSDARLADTALTHYCKSPVLDALLAYYEEQARDRNIEVQIRMTLAPELPVDETELSTVFANALENAIHACEKLPEGTPRRIEVTAVSAPHFCVEISNTCDGKAAFDGEGFPITHAPGHGIGTRSIAAFFAKHKAVYQYSVTEDGMFRLRFLINRPRPQDETHSGAV